jgi:hypothetical protein
VEETITGAVVERVLLDVLAENTYTFLVAASKEISTCVMMKVLRRMFVGLVVLLGHDDPLERLHDVVDPRYELCYLSLS